MHTPPPAPLHSFLPTFEPGSFKGREAQHYPEREDLFQQLIGAALYKQYAQAANAAPTKGRDGSIDGFLDIESPGPGICHKMSGPVIIECKDHKTSDNTATNIRQGWAKMETKLRKAATEGWPGHYQPWKRARGYCYCISAVINQSLRDEITNKIRHFFDSLPEEQCLPIDSFRLMDWSDLRNEFNQNALLIDAWLGIPHDNIVDHQTLLQGLGGFRDLLREESLPFVAPDEQAEFNPINLLSRIEAFEVPSGLLLKGSGGIGKTRTAIETAQLAANSGWRVLHLLPGEPVVTLEDIERVLFIDQSDCLLVIDYIEQLHIDFKALRHRSFARAIRDNKRLRLLATSRPNILKANPARDQLFDTVEMSLNGNQQQDLVKKLLPSIAAKAESLLGSELLLSICGHRPIIAVFIARDLELLAGQGKLVPAIRHPSPPDYLLARLREQLDAHPLTPPASRSSGILIDEPAADFVLTATILAATPFGESLLAPLMASVVEGQGAEPATQATRLIALLKGLGWCDLIGNDLFSAHDVVADEILTRVLWDANTSHLHLVATERLLSPLLNSPRLLGRYAVAFARLEESPFKVQLANASAQWLKSHAESLGQSWALSETDESAYALGAALDFTPWSEQLLACWSQLIQPWLDAKCQEPQARHLFYRGLKLLPEGEGARLISAVGQWLIANGHTPEACFILGPSLNRADLESDAPAIIEWATQWLARHGETLDSQFVLKALLNRTDLASATPVIIEHASRWLAHNGETMEAGFLLNTLLCRTDLASATPAIIERATQWLSCHGKDLDAQFVLKALLDRTDLASATPAIIERATQWLSCHGETREAGFVLKALLDRTDLASATPAIIEHATQWLALHGETQEAGFILDPLLSCIDLASATPIIIEHASRWLAHNGKTMEAGFVLKALLDRTDPASATPAIIERATQWLARHGEALDAQFVLKALLSRHDLGKQSMAAYRYCLEWLQTHHCQEDAEFILKRLLRRQELEDAAWSQTLSLTITWLHQHPHHPEHHFMLSDTLLRPNQHSEEQRQWAVAEARQLLANRNIPAKSREVLQKRLECFESEETTASTPKELSDRLRQATRSGNKVSTALLEVGIDAIHNRLADKNPASAGFFIPTLLALSHRSNGLPLRQEIIDAVKQTLQHPSLEEKHRRGLKRSAEELFGEGAWPDNETAQADLKLLSIR